MSLTEIKVRQAKPKEKIYFLADDDGLSLKVEPNGRKSWSYRYSLAGTNKRPRMKLGEYPVMSLKEARSVREDRRHFNRCINQLCTNSFCQMRDSCLTSPVGGQVFWHTTHCAHG